MAMQKTCIGCGRSLRISDEHLGKHVRCPQCHTVIEATDKSPRSVPMTAREQPASVRERPMPVREQPVSVRPAAPSSTPGPAQVSLPAAGPTTRALAPTSAPGEIAAGSSDRWFVKTEDGQQFGPVEKQQLTEWVGEGRLTAKCQVLQDGAPQWQWASDLYPVLTSGSGPTPPVASNNTNIFVGVAGAPYGDSNPPYDAGYGPSYASNPYSGSRRTRRRPHSDGPSTASVVLGSVAVGGIPLSFIPYMGIFGTIALICSLIGLILGCVSEAHNKSVGITLNAIALGVVVVAIIISVAYWSSVYSRYY